ncbi:hypothetical protein L873DRAFT_1154967 [Choiromyces venosus 120613-1]|uniref:Uncharacterized protein n=1 Tax=Choiromyces venosus 120613-1 TaxID=1336337 RepID=A0A3N4JIF0_9PEZI|nr:hypothetical protein L873DRAFT_1154967 [Choiromyces venosus 120613-1]
MTCTYSPKNGLVDSEENIETPPDIAIVPACRVWPTVVLEFGYAEPYEDLKADVKLLLEGSEGKITKAIIIKLQPLREGETQIQKGFVEMWHRIDGQVRKDGSR